MFKQASIDNIGRKGWNPDLDPIQLDAGHTTDAEWVRFSEGRVQPMGGVLELLQDESVYKFSMDVGYSTGYSIVASSDAVKVFDGASLSDISNPRANAYDSITDSKYWSGCMLGRIPVLCNPYGVMEYWNPQTTSTEMEDLPFDSMNSWFDMGYNAELIRSHKQFLFALKLQEGSDEFPDGVRWSHPADIGFIPPTWDETDPTNRAGKTTLGGQGGAIIDGLSLRDSFVVYRENGITIFDYIGGNNVWNVRNITTTFRLVNKSCVVEVDGCHFALGNNDICKFDGTNVLPLATDRVKKFLRKSINSNAIDACFVKVNRNKNEIWFCIPTGSNPYCDMALVYNWFDDTWQKLQLVACTTLFSIEYSPSNATWEDFGTQTWAQLASTWNQIGGTFNSPIPDNLVGCFLSCVENNTVFGAIDLDGYTPLGAQIERTGILIGEIKSVKSIVNLYPIGSGQFEIRFCTQLKHNDPVSWTPWQLYDCDVSRQIDIVLTGTYFGYSVRSYAGSIWSLLRIDIDYTDDGER